MLRRFRQLGYLLLLMVFLTKCIRVPKNVPPFSSTSISIFGPKNFNCFIYHQGNGAPTTKISLFINVITYYYDRNQKVIIDDQSLTIDPNMTPFPVSITINRTANSVITYADLVIQGTICSECANGYGDSREYYTTCPNVTIISTTPWSYLAARPQWTGGIILPQIYSPNAAIGYIDQVANVPNTCGCTVISF